VLSGSICAVSQNRCGCSSFCGRESIFKTNFQNQFSQCVFGNQQNTDLETGQRTAKTEAKTEAETGQELGVGFAPSSQNQFLNQRDNRNSFFKPFYEILFNFDETFTK